MSSWRQRGLRLGLYLLLLPAAASGADLFTIDSPAKWQRWQMPEGLVEIGAEGHLELVRFRKEINAVLDAHRFAHPTQKRDEVSGGIWRVDSGRETADSIIDGERATFWKPDADDPVQRWQVEIDLGRPVLVKEIRLKFPDRAGARPFRQFRVLVATGARIQAADDVFKFDLVYATTQPNAETDIAFAIDGHRDTTRVLDPALDVDLREEGRFLLVQYIRFAASEKSPDAALSEVEVIGVGDNIALGTLERGGSFENGLLARDPENQFDGLMDTFGHIATVYQEGDWSEEGLWWQVDLGALFWLDGIFVYWQDRGEALGSFLYEGFNAGSGYNILSSEGRRTTAGAIDFDPLILEPKWKNSRERRLRHFRYLFAPRKVRYLLWHGLSVGGHSWYSHPMEVMLFASGYPAQVVLRSDFIALGQIVGDDRPKAIKSLSWEAETPAATRLQLRSRSGSALEEVYTFYDKKGDEVTEGKWLSSPKVIRGPVDTAIVIGADWGEWSNLYQFAGERFKSQTPRRFLQLELIMSTEDPAIAPRVRSLSIEFEDALVQGARGQILPRSAEPNTDTRFTYTLWSSADAGDPGFDRLRFTTPSAVDPGEVMLRLSGREVAPADLSVQGDSLLFVDLPETVAQDSIQVDFTAKVLRNATVFVANLGAAGRPGLWQSVEAVERRANTVFLPALAASDRLIGDLQIASGAFTPNGDGINDSVEIRFALFKVEGTEPRVWIFDLAGRLVAELDRAPGGNIEAFSWEGRDRAGNLVRPGIYLCHIDARAESGKDSVVRSIAVSY